MRWRWVVCVCALSSLDVPEHLSMNESIECVCVCVHILACVMREYELQWSTHRSAPRSVCVSVCAHLWEWRCVWEHFTLAYACAILFNYRSGFEAEANSAIITGNTSFNILWKSTLCVWVVSCTYLFSLWERNRKSGRETQRERCTTYGGLVVNDLVLASWSCALPFIPPLLSAISHFRFVVPNGYAKCPFFPFFELLASQIFILPFTGPRVSGVKKEGRDLDLSIKDEQHLKCIKRGDEHTCSGMGRCKLWLNAGWHCKEVLLFDLLQVSGKTGNAQKEKKLQWE